MRTTFAAIALMLISTLTCAAVAAPPEGEGWRPLFNGEDLTGWKLPPRGEGHWKVVDGVIDYDARGGGDLWTEESFADFELVIEWRLKTAKELYGAETEPDGSPFAYSPDSGIYLRGTSKAQTNIWANAMGSGEVWGYRTDGNLPEEVRKGATPLVNADRPVGEWNQQKIIMRGDRLTVILNGQTVIDNAQLPGVPESGPIALQHHGGFNAETGRWGPASSCVQFRNIYLRELNKK